MRSVLFLFFAFLSVGCSEAPEPREENAGPALFSAADSLAFLITDYAGGLPAWEAVPVLRFDWVAVRDSEEVFRARHLWDRRSGAYRLEYSVGADSIIVAIFSADDIHVDPPAGKAYINGAVVDPAQMKERLSDAYERFINDTYWLLVPLKLFDPGVHRTLAPDSSDATSRVLRLTFENVGLTPGDRYWLRADSTGKILSWSFLLEGGGENYYRWSDYEYARTPSASLHLATRKQAGNRAILTHVLSTDSLESDIFLDPRPRLQE